MANDRLGLKGRQLGGFAINDRQALVITNDGTGNPDDLRELVAMILSSVKAAYGLTPPLSQPTGSARLNLMPGLGCLNCRVLV